MRTVNILIVVFILGCASVSQTGTEPPDNSKAVDLTGLAFLELSELEIPIECDTKIQIETDDINEADAKIFILGESFRVEYRIDGSSLGGENCETLVSILHDKKAYVGCEPVNQTAQCSWLTVDFNATESSVVSSQELEEKPGLEFSCKHGDFGSDFFRVTGNVCDLSSMTSEIFGY